MLVAWLKSHFLICTKFKVITNSLYDAKHLQIAILGTLFFCPFCCTFHAVAVTAEAIAVAATTTVWVEAAPQKKVHCFCNRLWIFVSLWIHSNWIECSRNQESERNNQFHSSTFNGVLCLDCVNVCKCDSQFEWKIVLIEFDYIRMAKFRRLIPLHSVTYRCLTLKAFKWMFAVLICVCVCVHWCEEGVNEWASERVWEYFSSAWIYITLFICFMLALSAVVQMQSHCTLVSYRFRQVIKLYFIE